ncbi:Streptomycin adenylyltransferase [Pilibacter termitis]|uniref:Streptomycin adenylyltransferase n=1 Tax=Pilibacter termitis TaxID=263852 RepID=A0A1T4Q9G1_9ENTE|nr:aminoglycoside 6-adenylyltransferase [Pilibacter termitis]SKA00392.1 Streptomycin adenylyltransferase [Pilibacter termitis]
MKRTKEEIWAMIMEFVHDHPEIVMIGTEGSRNNPEKEEDVFTDFDVTFFVENEQDIIRFEQLDWETLWGKTIVTQVLHENFLENHECNKFAYTRMSLFEDGNRIDLKIIPASEKMRYLEADTLNTIVWGGEKRATSDVIHHVKPPTPEELEECINEFYWVSTYVFKGIKRGDFLYAAGHFEKIVRVELFRLMSWCYFIGENVGKEWSRLAEIEKEIPQKYYGFSTLEQLHSSLVMAIEKFEETLKKMKIPIPEYARKTRKYIEENGTISISGKEKRRGAFRSLSQ